MATAHFLSNDLLRSAPFSVEASLCSPLSSIFSILRILIPSLMHSLWPKTLLNLVPLSGRMFMNIPQVSFLAYLLHQQAGIHVAKTNNMPMEAKNEN